jgi:hypothetical protein
MEPGERPVRGRRETRRDPVAAIAADADALRHQHTWMLRVASGRAWSVFVWFGQQRL